MPIKPDVNSLHTMLVREVVNKNKTFSSAQGTREKHIIHFKEDYSAEYCPLQGQFDNSLIKPNELLTFKIIYRKDFGDEISPVAAPDTKIVPGPTGITQPGQVLAQKIINMHGHPASLALMAAKEHHCKKLEYNPDLQISDLLADADTILEWLNQKQ